LILGHWNLKKCGLTKATNQTQISSYFMQKEQDENAADEAETVTIHE
jgi:hypothetical protein